MSQIWQVYAFEGESVCGRGEVDFLLYIHEASNSCDFENHVHGWQAVREKQMDCLLALLKILFLSFVQVETNVHFMENDLTHVDLQAKG